MSRTTLLYVHVIVILVSKMTSVMKNNANTNDEMIAIEEEFLSMPPTTVIDAEGTRKIAEIEANEEAQRVAKFQQIRFKDGDMKIVRIDPTKIDYKEDTIEMEGEPPKKLWRYYFMASEYMMGRWTKFKLMKFAPKWGRQILDNLKENHLTLKITRVGEGLGTDYRIISTSVK
jgi:hypothetical protein